MALPNRAPRRSQEAGEIVKIVGFQLVRSDGMESCVEPAEFRDGVCVSCTVPVRTCVRRVSSARSPKWCKVNRIALFAEAAGRHFRGRDRGPIR